MRTFFRHYIIMKIFRWFFCVLVHYQMLYLILLLTLSQVLLNFSDSLSSFIRKKYIYFHKIFLHTLSSLESFKTFFTKRNLFRYYYSISIYIDYVDTVFGLLKIYVFQLQYHPTL